MYLHILISFVLALLVALFQYKPWVKFRRLFWILTFFRTITIFILILLLLKISIDQTNYKTLKPNLILLIDNSQSIKYLKKTNDVIKSYENLIENTSLKKKFEIKAYKFGSDLKSIDSLNFKSKQTNINNSLKSLNNIYKDEVAPIVIITDGNQTFGESYINEFNLYNQPIYPIIIGDTLLNKDLRIKKIINNKYTFLENEFPVDIFVDYNGKNKIETKFTISSNNENLIEKKIILSEENNAKTFTVYLKSESVGLNEFKAKLSPLSDEKIIYNNEKKFAIEAIDQKIKVAFISDISHPDIASYRAVLSNKKNFDVDIINPLEFVEKYKDYKLTLLYQPNNSFKPVFDLVNKNKINSFIVSGTNTDIAFLNSVQNIYKQELINEVDEFQAYPNYDFDDILLEEINFINYPTIKSNFGDINLISKSQIVLNKLSKGIETNQPLLFLNNTDGHRQVIFLAEDIWKWRINSFKINNEFRKFDSFFCALFQYLSNQNSYDKIIVYHELIFDGTKPIEIYAKSFDENFNLKSNDNLVIEIKSKNLSKPIIYDMILKNGLYEINLDNLMPGKYSYTIAFDDGKSSKKGKFEILPFNMETRFVNSNYRQLEKLANISGGKSFNSYEFENLIDELVKNDQFNSVKKLEKKSLSLININYLLLLFLVSLSIEWFIRKYNGLI